VRLIEDSDGEDKQPHSSAAAAETAAAETALDCLQQQQQQPPQARCSNANRGCQEDVAPGEQQELQPSQQPLTTALPGRPGKAVGRSSNSVDDSVQQWHDSSIEKENQQGEAAVAAAVAAGGGGASAAGSSKPKRAPFGEILATNILKPSVATGAGAADPPGKQPAVAVAAATAAAAAAAAEAVELTGQAGRREETALATEAAAAVAVSWPQESAAVYQLHAVVRHKGPLASSGHFISDVLNSQVSHKCWA
jgi:hypothetical protein